MKTLLILGARRMQVPAILAAKEMGLKVVAADPQSDAPGLRIADDYSVCDLADEGRCLALARRHRVDGVMTLAADFPLPMVARICEELSLPGVSPNVAIRATNKRIMRRVLAEEGVPCPISLHAATLDDAVAAVEKIPGSTIFKPTLSHGGRGITRLPVNPGRKEIAAAYDRAIAATRADGILVEEFVDGPEFSVEALSFDGRTEVVAITDKSTSGDPYWVELGHSQPSRWPPRDTARLAQTARASAGAVGVDWAASHTEIRLGPKGPCVMEIGARLGGGYITSHLVPLSTGIDMVRATVQLALGIRPELKRGDARGAAIRFLTAPHGLLRSVSGLDRAREVDGVAEIEVYANLGDLVAPPVDATGRIGHVIATGHDARSAVERAERARDLIDFAVEPHPGSSHARSPST
jgi:biotin carboxylase